MRRGMREIVSVALPWCVGNLASVLRERRLGHLNRYVRNDEWEIKEERLLPMLADEVERFLGEFVLGVRLAGGSAVVAGQRFLDIVSQQEFRIVVMRVDLAQVPIEQVEP